MSTCLELKNKEPSTVSWQPSASIENLRARAYIIHLIRKFFASHHVMEVETPLLAHSTATDSVIHSFAVKVPGHSLMYLQTSPEFAMKRLLAAGSGAIYQICKAFRQDESGQRHNPEFTMLEWYRPGFSYTQLMDEVDQLVQTVLASTSAARWTYQKIFLHYLKLDPFTATDQELKNCAVQHGIDVHFTEAERDDWLNLLMSHLIEPQLIQPTFVYNFPASQAALSQIRLEGSHIIAERFELYINGMEIANGYHELCDAKEQEQRFIQDNLKREALGLPILPVDYHLVAALQNGMPDCSGVALGVDRLVMLALDAKTINETLSFSINNA